ncbi:MADS-box transcription factor [Sarracenia purpurea var. burkii]
MMLERMEALRKKEHDLEERNRHLRAMIHEEEDHARAIQCFGSASVAVLNNGIQVQPSPSNPIEAEPTLHIGSRLFLPPPAGIGASTVPEDSSNFLHGWLL